MTVIELTVASEGKVIIFTVSQPKRIFVNSYVMTFFLQPEIIEFLQRFLCESAKVVISNFIHDMQILAQVFKVTFRPELFGPL